ncbi:ROK family protein [Bacillus sp. Marseille-Q1617]|uniref:ROK family protein n=1 Tax=Bacillus sp. Marseille-Q1617 TaxID=2736887 RepID=UPI00158F470A|nr:ROK family protein [Bacillus sp. Marseille-Q1617]
MKQYIAFDIGGTYIKYGIVRGDGKVVVSFLTDTEAHLGGPSIVQKLVRLSRELLETYQAAGVAISTAGRVDADRGVILGASNNIPEYKGTELKKLISTELNLPVEVRNDADCAALCEHWLGGHGADNFIMLTVGTGVGGGIILNGQLYSGHSFSAGEWGYMRIEGEQFEKIASFPGLIKMAKEYKSDREWTGKEIFDSYDQGDPDIQKAVAKFYKHLAVGISNLIYIFDPEKVVIGGGIALRGEAFLKEIKEEVRKYTKKDFYQRTELVLAKYQNHSGMVGAVYHFMQRD